MGRRWPPTWVEATDSQETVGRTLDLENCAGGDGGACRRVIMLIITGLENAIWHAAVPLYWQEREMAENEFWGSSRAQMRTEVSSRDASVDPSAVASDAMERPTREDWNASWTGTGGSWWSPQAWVLWHHGGVADPDRLLNDYMLAERVRGQDFLKVLFWKRNKGQ